MKNRFIRHWWILLLCSLLGAALMWFYHQYSSVKWATAQIRLVEPLLDSSDEGLAELTIAEKIQSDISILNSFPVLERVAFLLAQLEEQELIYSDAEGRYNEPIGNFKRIGVSDQAESTQEAATVVEEIDAALRIQREGDSDIIQIAARLISSLDAVAVANTVAEEYIRLKQWVVDAEISQMEQQLADYDRRIKEVDAKRRAFLREYPNFIPRNTVNTEDTTSLEERIADLDKKLASLDARKTELNRLRQTIAKLKDPVLQLIAARPYLPDLNVDAALRQIQSLENKQMRFLQEYMPEHPLIAKNAQAIADAKLALGAAISKALATRTAQVTQEIARLQEEKRNPNKPSPTALRLQTEYDTLTREIDDQSQIFGELLTAVQEKKTAASTLPERMVVAYAVRARPLHPPYLRMLYGLVGGLIVGVLVALALSVEKWPSLLPTIGKRPGLIPSTDKWVKLRPSIDRWSSLIASVGRRPKDATPGKSHVDPGLPIIGRIPKIDFSRAWTEKEPFTADTSTDGDLDAAIKLSPPAALVPGSEAFRNLRTHVLFHETDPKPLLILFTSARPGEGVSTVTSNLAVAIAQAGKRTLLIESDLVDPQLHDAFGLSRVPGITDILLESATVDDAVRNASDLLLGDLGPDVIASVMGIGNLNFLFAGIPVSNASEILSMPAFAELLASFKGSYDVILMDGGSILSNTETHVLAAQADGVILVHCPRGWKRKKPFDRAIEMLGVADVWGIVLNEKPKEFL